jgi:hypothetical protein
VSALINPATLVLVAAAAAMALAPAADVRGRLRRLAARLAHPALLAVIAAAVAANLVARAAIGHTAPGDFMQEIIAASSFAERATLYPEDVNGEARRWLASHPPPLLSWVPERLRRPLLTRREQGRNRLVAQAHPPTLVLGMLPVIHAAGPYAAFWLLTLLTVAGAAWASWLLSTIYFPSISRSERWLAVLLVAGWQPVLASVRDGQVSVLIGALIVVSWSALRSGRQVRGGIALGAATALKFYPALLLLPLLLGRHFTAARWMALTCAAAAAAASLVAGPGAWLAYAQAAQSVMDGFSRSADNLSILARLGWFVPTTALGPVFLALAAAFTGITVLAHARADGRSAASAGAQTSPVGGTRATFDDRQWAAFTSLAVLLSPVAWPHYVFALVQPLTLLLMDAWRRPGRWALLAWMTGVLILSLPAGATWAIWRLSLSPIWLPAVVSPGLVILLSWWAVIRTRSRAAAQPEPAAA